MPDRNGKYTDFTIVCDGHEFPAHKVIICSESKVMEKELEHRMKELGSSTILHEEFDAATVDRMLGFVYEGRYELPGLCEVQLSEPEQGIAELSRKMDVPTTQASTPAACDDDPPCGDADDHARDSREEAFAKLAHGSGSQTPSDGNDESTPSQLDAGTGSPTASTLASRQTTISHLNAKLISHARMYAIGDYYAIPKLQAFAKAAFQSEPGWALEHFVEVIAEVSKRPGSHDRGLRDALRQRAEEHLEELVGDENSMEAMMEDPNLQDFAADMLRHLAPMRRLQDAEIGDERRQAAAEALSRQEMIEKLQDRLRLTQEEIARVGSQATQRVEHVEAMMADLERKVKSLPSVCKNGRCERTWDPLILGRKGHRRYGCGEGEWEVRCRRCRCKIAQ